LRSAIGLAEPAVIGSGKGSVRTTILALNLAGGANPPLSVGCSRENAGADDRLAVAVEGLGTAEGIYLDVLVTLGPPAVITTLPDGFAFLHEITSLSTGPRVTLGMRNQAGS
jgi:hypothetical protein